MNNKIILLMLAIALVFMSCGKPASTQAATPAAAPAAAETKAVSDGSEDLTIDFQVNLSAEDEANRFLLER
jgi:outer membrane lipoprotein-sorting protein